MLRIILLGLGFSLLSRVIDAPEATAQDIATQDIAAEEVVQPPTIEKPTAAASMAKDPTPAITDRMRELQSTSVKTQQSVYGHWGNRDDRFSVWTNHSNRLIPVYTFGITLDSWRSQGSTYADPDRLTQLYGRVPEGTVNPTAMYFDQTDIYDLQVAAMEAGCEYIILMVFDGMDWQTTRAAAIYQQGRVAYESGRGTGLAFQDERRTKTDFGWVVTSPYSAGAKTDVNAQRVLNEVQPATGGFDPTRGAVAPWREQVGRDYLMGLDRQRPHSVTDSAASATALTTGIKTYNGAINVAPDGTPLVPIARRLQDDREMMIGVVTSVPVSHATPAAAYANNVSRKDYQDLARDLLGLPSSAHRNEPLAGVDVLIGAGWGEGKKSDKMQGDNFASGNPYLHQDDLRKVNVENGGKYVVAQRTKGESGRELLMAAAEKSVRQESRLLGFFGTRGGHLPFQTADGGFDPTFDIKGQERYTDADLTENPTLADMTQAALLVLEQSVDGFWLMIEAGDVDWANHANNLDNSIGAALSGEAAFKTVMEWIDENRAWDVTAVIVTADHGHYLVVDHPEKIAIAGKENQ